MTPEEIQAKQAARRHVVVSPQCLDMLRAAAVYHKLPMGRLIFELIECEAEQIRLDSPGDSANPVQP